MPNILDPKFRYIPASTHSDPAAFRERMKQYAEQASKQPSHQTQEQYWQAFRDKHGNKQIRSIK